MKRLLVLILVMAAMTPVCVDAQRRAKGAVPPLKEIVKEVFVKEFDMKPISIGKIEPPLTRAYKTITHTTVLARMDSDICPDTLYITFDMPNDGDSAAITVWRHNGKAYIVSEYGRKENIDINGYYVTDMDKLRHQGSVVDKDLHPIILSWNRKAFDEYAASNRNTGSNVGYIIRIIRNCSNYRFDTLIGLYGKGLVN